MDSRNDIRRTTQGLVAAITTITLLAVPTVASAREDILKGQPDVRNKYEYRAQRFELAPTFEMTVNADYKHAVSGGIKAEYHLSDSLSFGASIFFGTGIDTALTGQVSNSLPDSHGPDGDPTPTRAEFEDHLNTIPLHGSVHATFTPWFGKMALFGKGFVAFDLYVTGGFGFANLKTNWGEDNCAPEADGQVNGMDVFDDPRNDCPYNSGFRPGVMIGVGMHVYLSKWIALDIAFRDYFFNDNPSGQDANKDGQVDSSDPRFLGHLFYGVGISFMLPPKIKVTR
jgi:outer membrane beta-barrel protein